LNLFRRPELPDRVNVAGRELPLVATRRRGARGVRLRADSAAGAVRISLPWRGGVPEALALLAGHQDWLAAQVAKWPSPVPFVPGAVIPFDGGELMLEWHIGHPRTPQRHGDSLRLGGPLELLHGRTLRWLKAEALADMAAGTRELAAAVDRPVTAIRLGDPRSRWGSCASGGRIAYSWRLILAPDFVRRNVVAHEVAHLVHANHGPDFHALLGALDGHAATSRRWLARHGAALHWVGREA
jgi:predicted metal-dependent hydrolase